eukprot:365200-Chlamydomonas_euryale.AAC.14
MACDALYLRCGWARDIWVGAWEWARDGVRWWRRRCIPVLVRRESAVELGESNITGSSVQAVVALNADGERQAPAPNGQSLQGPGWEGCIESVEGDGKAVLRWWRETGRLY